MLVCPNCKGWSATPADCQKCWGTGRITVDQIEPGMAPCHRCQTEGLIWHKGMIDECPKCKGKQYVSVTNWFKLKESVINYFVFTYPWRSLLMWMIDYLPDEWGDQLANRLFPIGAEIYFVKGEG